MKKNIKLLGTMAIVGVVTFTSCQKDSVNPIDPMSMEIASEDANVRLANSGYQTNITNELISTNGADYYTAGTIEYRANNQVVAVVDFATADNERATLSKDGAISEFDLKKKKEWSKYKKVIVKPLVKTDDCKYIVEGIIKYYDYQTGEYLATIDYGDGTCDEWATKTWPAGSDGNKTWAAGSKTFSLDDWNKGGKK